MKVLDIEKKKTRRENKEENIKTPESSVPRQKNTKDPNIKERIANFKRRGGDGEGGVGATIFFSALEEGRIACHPTCSSKNPITRLRLYFVNDKSPSLSFLLVLCKSIPAPMVTASEQQSLP